VASLKLNLYFKRQNTHFSSDKKATRIIFEPQKWFFIKNLAI